MGGGGQIVSGGGGVETFWGADGIISVVQSFFLWAFFLWLALFFDEDISLKRLKSSFSHDKILPKIDSPKRTINCSQK